MVLPDELLSMQDPHGEAGYFRLLGVELSRSECYALDAIAQATFLAFHELVRGGSLPAHINGLTPPQLTRLREAALAIAAGSLVDADKGKMPIELKVDAGELGYQVRSHRKNPKGAQGDRPETGSTPNDAPGHG